MAGGREREPPQSGVSRCAGHGPNVASPGAVVRLVVGLVVIDPGESVQAS